MILVVLGKKWVEAIPIFRLLAPTILVFALINPLAWLMFALGMVGRSLRVALVLAPIVIAGYLIGLPHGPKGVAFAYSATMLLWAGPHIAWCVHGTVISFRDILVALSRPLGSVLVAGALAFGLHFYWGRSLPAVARLALGVSVLTGTYIWVLMYVMKQKQLYLDLLRGLRRSPGSEDKEALAST
jgi:PST family polysaccharide transporter